MKKLKTYESIKIPAVTLYLEDLEKINQVFQENAQEYNIKADEYGLDSFDEIQNIAAQKLNKFAVKSGQPYISIKFDKDGACISFMTSDRFARGMAKDIEEILKHRKKWQKYVTGLDALVIMFFLLALQGAILIAVNYKYVQQIPNYLMRILEILFVGASVLYFVKIKHTEIHLNNKPMKFWSKEKEKVFLLIIGGGITFLVQILLKLI